jgi:hypothetical protein
VDWSLPPGDAPTTAKTIKKIKLKKLDSYCGYHKILKCWRWIGDLLRMPVFNITRQAPSPHIKNWTVTVDVSWDTEMSWKMYQPYTLSESHSPTLPFKHKASPHSKK